MSDDDPLLAWRAESASAPKTQPGLLLILLPIIGITLCLLLAEVHLQVMLGNPAEGLGCGPEAGCETIAASAWSAPGGIPLWALGMGLYAALLAFAPGARSPGRRGARLAFLVMAIAGLSLLGDLVLGLVMAFVEGALCPLCAATYLVNIGLFVVASQLWRAAPEPDSAAEQPSPEPGGISAVIGLALVLALVILGAGIWLEKSLTRQQRERVSSWLAELPDTPPAAPDAKGRPSLGSEDAALSIVVFQDLHCRHCHRLRRALELVRRHPPASLRIRFVQFPLDGACNPGVRLRNDACSAARAALYAHRKGRFFPLLDALDGALIPSPRVAGNRLRELGLDPQDYERALADGSLDRELAADIALGKKFGVTLLPTYTVNGYRFEGQASAWMLRKILGEVARRQAP